MGLVQRAVQDVGNLSLRAGLGLADADIAGVHRRAGRRDRVEGHEQGVDVRDGVELPHWLGLVTTPLQAVHVLAGSLGNAPHEGEVRRAVVEPDPEDGDASGPCLVNYARGPAQVADTGLLGCCRPLLRAQVGARSVSLVRTKLVLGTVRGTHVQVEGAVREPGDGPAAGGVVSHEVCARPFQRIPVVRVEVLDVLADLSDRLLDRPATRFADGGPLTRDRVVGGEASHAHVQRHLGRLREGGQTVRQVVACGDSGLVRIALAQVTAFR